MDTKSFFESLKHKKGQYVKKCINSNVINETKRELISQFRIASFKVSHQVYDSLELKSNYWSGFTIHVVFYEFTCSQVTVFINFTSKDGSQIPYKEGIDKVLNAFKYANRNRIINDIQKMQANLC